MRQRVTEIRFGDSSVGAIVLGMSLILGFGGYAVMRGALTLGGLVAFYGYVVRLFEPVSIAIDLQSRLQRVGASLRRILVGGVNIRDFSARNLRTLVTLVPQDPVLFDATIRDNLLYGNPRCYGWRPGSVAGLTQLDTVLRRLPLRFARAAGPAGQKVVGRGEEAFGVGANAFAESESAAGGRDHESARYATGGQCDARLGFISWRERAGGDLAPTSGDPVVGTDSGGRTRSLAKPPF